MANKIEKPKKQLRIYRVIRYYASPAEIIVWHYSRKKAIRLVEKKYGKAQKTEANREKEKPQIFY